MKQQLAHHTVTGCNMRPGDLLASGTISGPVIIFSFKNKTKRKQTKPKTRDPEPSPCVRYHFCTCDFSFPPTSLHQMIFWPWPMRPPWNQSLILGAWVLWLNADQLVPHGINLWSLILGAWVLWFNAGAFLAGSQDGSLGLEWPGEKVLAGWRHGKDDGDNNGDDNDNDDDDDDDDEDAEAKN